MTTLAEAAGWVAPIATAIAATMTAANLGARVTGWGFVVFVVGSIAWCAVGISSGQTNLLLANGFLTVVNVIGIWRWLGRQAHYEREGKAAVEESGGDSPRLLSAAKLAGIEVYLGGEKVATGVEGMIDCRTGEIVYTVVSVGGVGGVGERLVAVPRDALVLDCDVVSLRIPRSEFDALPEWAPAETS